MNKLHFFVNLFDIWSHTKMITGREKKQGTEKIRRKKDSKKERREWA